MSSRLVDKSAQWANPRLLQANLIYLIRFVLKCLFPQPSFLPWSGRSAGTGQQRGRVEKGRWHWATAGKSKAAGTGQQRGREEGAVRINP